MNSIFIVSKTPDLSGIDFQDGIVQFTLKTMKSLINALMSRFGWIRLSDFGAFPPGHYYSPIPAKEEVETYISSRPKIAARPLGGIDLNDEVQARLIDEYSSFYKEL